MCLFVVVLVIFGDILGSALGGEADCEEELAVVSSIDIDCIDGADLNFFTGLVGRGDGDRFLFDDVCEEVVIVDNVDRDDVTKGAVGEDVISSVVVVMGNFIVVVLVVVVVVVVGGISAVIDDVKSNIFAAVDVASNGKLDEFLASDVWCCDNFIESSDDNVDGGNLTTFDGESVSFVVGDVTIDDTFIVFVSNAISEVTFDVITNNVVEVSDVITFEDIASDVISDETVTDDIVALVTSGVTSDCVVVEFVILEVKSEILVSDFVVCDDGVFVVSKGFVRFTTSEFIPEAIMDIDILVAFVISIDAFTDTSIGLVFGVVGDIKVFIDARSSCKGDNCEESEDEVECDFVSSTPGVGEGNFDIVDSCCDDVFGC